MASSRFLEKFLNLRPKRRGAGVPAISDAEKIERHGEKPMLRPTLGPVANDNLFRVVGCYNRFGRPADQGLSRSTVAAGDATICTSTSGSVTGNEQLCPRQTNAAPSVAA
jgi:hypothetical protein